MHLPRVQPRVFNAFRILQRMGSRARHPPVNASVIEDTLALARRNAIFALQIFTQAPSVRVLANLAEQGQQQWIAQVQHCATVHLKRTEIRIKVVQDAPIKKFALDSPKLLQHFQVVLLLKLALVGTMEIPLRVVVLLVH